GLAACAAQLRRPDAAVDAVRARVLAAPLAVDRTDGSGEHRCRAVVPASHGRVVSRSLGRVAWDLGRGVLLLLIVKLVYEHQSGSSLFEGDLPLVSAAHLFGTLGGLLGTLL